MGAKMRIKEKFVKITVRLLVLAAAGMFVSCESETENTFSFNYNTILNREFRNNIGKIIPVAYEKAIETDGDISADGNYMYYTSNRENGNFDIYLRDLNDITTVRITSHAAKDSEPAISPDGKYLVYVSARENPEGDIYLLKIDPEKIIKQAKKSVSGNPVLDEKSVNLTQLLYAETGAVQIVRNANPAWSPDGNKIAFMSRRGGQEDIWIMNRDGSSLTQFTQGGGVYPRFSPDGSKIIYISYKNKNSQGDVYIKNVDDGSETRLELEGGIKLFPGFLSNNNEIIYTLIQSDTNNDGILSLNDNAVIMYYNTKTKYSYPMTLPSTSSFNAKWLMPPWSQSHEGIIMFSDIQDENINVNIIPGYGIIPKKTKASYQYTLAESYAQEYNDEERYRMALKRVYYFFGDKKDDESSIYTARAMTALWQVSSKRQDRKQTAEIEKIFESLSKNGNLYVRAQYERIKSGSAKAAAAVKKAMNEALADKKSTALAPYLEEDLARIYIERGDAASALATLSDIKVKYPKYESIASVHMEYALLVEKAPASTFTDSTVYTIEHGSNVQKVRMYNHIISLFEKNKNHPQKIDYLNSLIEANKDKKLVSSLCYYISAVTYQALRRNDEMIAALKQSAALSNINDLMYYKAHLALGTAYQRQGEKEQTEEHMALAITNYKRYFADSSYRSRVRWLIDFYEDEGADYVKAHKLTEAISTFDKYRKLIKYIYSYKFFSDMYSIYGPRAHTLYIDAVYELKRGEGLAELEKEYDTDLFKARIESDKAYIYGLAYIYTKKAIEHENNPSEMFEAFAQSMENIDWAQFIDDSFIDPYILKSWIYQYADLRRAEDNTSLDRIINRYFPPLLWEQNISILERALSANDENLYPEHEGNIHLNMGNNYFLLVNYPLALEHYEQARKYKKNFDSKINQALFYFHMAYCYWQNDDLKKARAEMEQAEWLYQSFVSDRKNIADYAFQFYTIYKYYALFSRIEGDYEKAIEQYQNILLFCAKYKINIDRARYFQEIAHCYQELGKYDQAIDALQMADRMLEKYPKDEPTYKLNIRFFNVFRISVWDLGVDTFVIGDNKIFYALDTRSKKLLNLSMFENIELQRSNYDGAIKYLEKKTTFLKNRKNSVDKESLVITHNNLGYYNTMAGNYEKAISHFDTAWDLAATDGFLEGSFTAVMNRVNVYAYMLESGACNLDEAPLDALHTRILAYRDSYENETYKQGLETLKADAEKLDREVSAEEISNLKSETEAQTREVYYKIDISLGVLDYYRAELRRISFSMPTVAGVDGAYVIYNEHKDIYNIYQSALNRFTGAAEQRQDFGDAALEVKLLINIGNCYARIGSLNEAHAVFLNAKTVAQELGGNVLLFETAFALGSFLKDNVLGREASLRNAESNIKEALGFIRKEPLAFSAGRASQVYEALLEVCAAQGKWDEAFVLDEEYTAFRKAMLARLDSEPLLSDYMTKATVEPERSRKPASGIALIKFIRIGDKLHIWKWGSAQAPGKLVHTTEDIASKDILKKNLTAFEGQNAAPLFIVYNQSLFDLLKNEQHNLSGIQAVFVTSVSQAKLSKDDVSLKTLYYTGAGAAQLPAFAQINRDTKKDPAGYDVIADDLVAPVFTAAKLFQSRLNPAVLFVYSSGNSFDEIFTIVEAGHYAGASAVIVCSDSKAENMAAYLGQIPGGTGGIMGASGGNLMVFGAPLRAAEKSIMSAAYRTYRDKLQNGQFADAAIELQRYKKIIDIKLSENTNISTYDNELYHAESKYANDRLALFLLQNDLTGARSFCDNTETRTLSASELAVYKIYLKFYEGETESAAALINANNAIEKSLEYFAFKALTGLASGIRITEVQKDITNYISAISEFDKNEKADGVRKCISTDRMRLLIATYLEMSGYREKAAEILIRNIPANEKFMAANDREIALMISVKADPQLTPLLNGKKNEISSFTSSWKNKPMSFIKTMEDFRNVSNIESGSAAAVLLHLTENNNSGDVTFLQELLMSDLLEYILEKSYPLDAVRLNLRLASLLNDEEDYEAAWVLLDKLNKNTSGKMPAVLRKQILAQGSSTLLALKRFQDAYTLALQAETLIPEHDKSYMPVQFILLDAETQATAADAGKPRLERLLQKTDITAYEKFMLRLFQARIELKYLALIKNPQKEDGKAFEEKYLDALDLAVKNPDLLSQVIYRSLLEEIADAYINYRMGTGDNAAALNFAEIKKHLLVAVSFSGTSSAIAGKINFMRTLSIANVQKKLGNDSIIIYLIRNGGNVFAWIISKDHANSTVLSGVSAQLDKAITDYNNAAIKRINTDTSVKAIGSIFSSFGTHTAGAKTIYLITDEFMERVPFEAIKGKDSLYENADILFLSSMTSALNDFSFESKKLLLCGDPANLPSNVSIARLEKVAATESGMQILGDNGGKAGIVHFLESLRYKNREFDFSDKPYLPYMKRGEGVYVRSLPVSESAFAVYNSINGAKLSLINNAVIQDKNGAYFLDIFYRELARGTAVRPAFEKAKNFYNRRSGYRHPAYWCFIRLYANGL